MNHNGGPIDENTKLAFWNKGFMILVYDPSKIKKDPCSAVMS